MAIFEQQSKKEAANLPEKSTLPSAVIEKEHSHHKHKHKHKHEHKHDHKHKKKSKNDIQLKSMEELKRERFEREAKEDLIEF